MKQHETDFAIVENNKILLKPWAEHPLREIGEVKNNSPEDSVKYFQERFVELENKVSELETLIEESVNKGSFLMKLLHLKESLGTHEGIGNYMKLRDRLSLQENLLNDIIEKNRGKNTEIKKGLIEEAKIAVEKINWKEATEEVHEIKTRWIKTGNATDDQNKQLEETFWQVISGFFDKKKNFYEDKKRLSEKNKKAYEELINEAEKLGNLHGKERFDKVKQLKQDWADTGKIPREEYTPLVNQFNSLLKPGRRKSPGTFDIKSALNKLEVILNNGERANYKDLQFYMGQLKTFRPQEYELRQAKKQVYRKIQMIKERDFITKIAFNRFKGFYDKTPQEQASDKITILEELITRDEADLKTYQENSEKFAAPNGDLNPMVEKQLNQQKNKVSIKKELLNIFKIH